MNSKEIANITDMYSICLQTLCNQCFSFGVIEGNKSIVLDRIGHLLKKCKNAINIEVDANKEAEVDYVALLTGNLLSEKKGIQDIEEGYQSKKKCLIESIYSDENGLKDKLLNTINTDLSELKDQMLPGLIAARCKKYKEKGMLSNLFNLEDETLCKSLFNGLDKIT